MTKQCEHTRVEIYTDGSSLGNPGPGGWGAILRYKEHTKELSEGYTKTTNNRMEILAAIRALEALTRDTTEVDLYTDSKYLSDAVNKKWIKGWIRNGWKTAARKPVKNQDLWVRLSELLTRHRVHFHWVKGHNGHPENERCDILAREAASGQKLLVDEGYEG